MKQQILAAIITTSLINISTHAMYEKQTLVIHAYDTKSHNKLLISMLYTHDKSADLYETKKTIDPTPKRKSSDFNLNEIPTCTDMFHLNRFRAAEKEGNVDRIKMLFNDSTKNENDPIKKNLYVNYIIRGAARHGHLDVIKLFPISEYRFSVDWPLVLEISKRYGQQDTEKFILDYLKINK